MNSLVSIVGVPEPMGRIVSGRSEVGPIVCGIAGFVSVQIGGP